MVVYFDKTEFKYYDGVTVPLSQMSQPPLPAHTGEFEEGTDFKHDKKVVYGGKKASSVILLVTRYVSGQCVFILEQACCAGCRADPSQCTSIPR